MRNINTARFCQRRLLISTQTQLQVYIIKTTKKKKNKWKKPKMFYLRSVDLLFHDGNLVSEDGSIILNHHSLFFHVSSSKQSQALYNTNSSFTSVKSSIILVWERNRGYLNAWPSQIDVSSPLTLHPAVLRWSWVHHWRLVSFPLGNILIWPGTAAGYSLQLGPLGGFWQVEEKKKKNRKNHVLQTTVCTRRPL